MNAALASYSTLPYSDPLNGTITTGSPIIQRHNLLSALLAHPTLNMPEKMIYNQDTCPNNHLSETTNAFPSVLYDGEVLFKMLWYGCLLLVQATMIFRQVDDTVATDLNIDNYQEVTAISSL